MKSVRSIIAVVALSLPFVVFAQGGKQLWEKKLEARDFPVKQATAAREMGHTAAEHKYWMVDDPTAAADGNYKAQHSHMMAHMEHMGHDHKWDSVGSN